MNLDNSEDEEVGSKEFDKAANKEFKEDTEGTILMDGEGKGKAMAENQFGKGKKVQERNKQKAKVHALKEKGGSNNDDKENQKVSRQVVDKGHVCKLVSDCCKYFAEYSKGRKQNSIQLIPKTVWKDVYDDYLVEFPNSLFQKENLRDHLRKTLVEMKSGVNNPEGGERATT
ncbi:unnamed protein product [Calypogeia fissa]